MEELWELRRYLEASDVAWRFSPTRRDGGHGQGR